MEKIYDSSPLTTGFTAGVTSCIPSEGGKYSVTLDRTAFFPGGGGQECDTGYIGGARVASVTESGGEIFHLTDTPFDVGTEVKCSVDREKRLSRMASHTGEHIVSALMHRNFGFSNVGFHMGSGDVTADFDGVIDAAQLAAVEAGANAVIRENLPVTVSYPDSETLSAMKYRSKLDLTENVRIVSVGDFDRCACCAPHMPETGMIGMLVFTGFQHWRGGIRVHMLCGADAVSFCRAGCRPLRCALQASVLEAGEADRFRDPADRGKCGSQKGCFRHECRGQRCRSFRAVTGQASPLFCTTAGTT